MTAEPALYPVESVVPHAAPMSLLDRIEHWAPGQLRALFQVRADQPFTGDSGMPGWVGIEHMAQAIAAYAGVRARREQQPIRIGFLVGTRRYTCNHPVFPFGATLAVDVVELLQGDNNLSVFQCTIEGLGEHSDILASANLNVFHPEDPEAFLRGQAHD